MSFVLLGFKIYGYHELHPLNESRKFLLMGKARVWLRTVVSIPFYVVSVYLSLIAVMSFIATSMVMLNAPLTDREVGAKIADLLFSIIGIVVARGFWLLGRYIRTLSFKGRLKVTPLNTDPSVD